LLGGIKVNNTLRVFEEDFTRLNRYTKLTPLVKSKKETGEPHACSRSLALPRQAEAEGMGVGVGVT
jgi:hypothetical protein